MVTWQSFISVCVSVGCGRRGRFSGVSVVVRRRATQGLQFVVLHEPAGHHQRASPWRRRCSWWRLIHCLRLLLGVYFIHWQLVLQLPTTQPVPAVHWLRQLNNLSVVGKSGVKSFTHIRNLSRNGLSSLKSAFFCKSQSFHRNKYADRFSVERQRYLMLYRTTIIAHDILTVLTMTTSQLVWWNVGIKLHLKQKHFNDSCVPFCVGKQAADLSRC